MIINDKVLLLNMIELFIYKYRNTIMVIKTEK